MLTTCQDNKPYQKAVAVTYGCTQLNTNRGIVHLNSPYLATVCICTLNFVLKLVIHRRAKKCHN